MKWARRRHRSGADLPPSSRSSYLVLYTFCVGAGSREWNESCTTVSGQREPTCFASNHGAADWWPAAWKVRPVDPLLILWWSYRSGRTFKCSFHQKDTHTHKINGGIWALLDALTGTRAEPERSRDRILANRRAVLCTHAYSLFKCELAWRITGNFFIDWHDVTPFVN